ncbi:MAG: hypothetical protein Q7R72_00590 [bacterium]|nr:hypothetical protein [bacterium]
MKKSEVLDWLGFRCQEDLGINAERAGWFFRFDDQTYAFDEEGKVWTLRGFKDPGEIFYFASEPILWESELVSEENQ